MDIPRSSHDTASIIDWVRKLYTKLTTIVSDIKLVFLIHTLSFILSILLILLIKLVKYRLTKSLKRDIELSLDNYKRAKSLQVSIKQDLATIRGTIDTLSEKSIKMSSILIKDIQDVHTVLSAYQSKLDLSLSNLSASDGFKNSQYFSLISEQTLWDNRVEAYQYRL